MHVECYAGYRGDERPVRVIFEDRSEVVSSVEDRWYSPGLTYFRVTVKNGDRYILRRDDVQEVWTLEGFRSARTETGGARANY